MIHEARIIKTHPLPIEDELLAIIIRDLRWLQQALHSGEGSISQALGQTLLDIHKQIMVAFWSRVYQVTNLNEHLSLRFNLADHCIEEVEREDEVDLALGPVPVVLLPTTKGVN